MNHLKQYETFNLEEETDSFSYLESLIDSYISTSNLYLEKLEKSKNKDFGEVELDIFITGEIHSITESITALLAKLISLKNELTI